MRINAQALENKGQFIDKGNVEIALGILNDFGGLSHLE